LLRSLGSQPSPLGSSKIFHFLSSKFESISPALAQQDVRLHSLRLSHVRSLVDLHEPTMRLPFRPPQLP
jgi:hypothetical protein